MADEPEKEEKEKKYTGATPYDDVFRTLVTECSPLVIPVLNEAFGTQYVGDEKIVFQHNEHFLRQQDGREQKIITDSSFLVVGKDKKISYLMECQSTTDSSMLIRIYEYIHQIALDESILQHDVLDAYIPCSTVLYLRSTKTTSNEMTIRLHYLDSIFTMKVPCLKVKDYTIDEIFHKKLFFLIPFYIFTYESRFKDIEANEEKKQQLQKEYSSIAARLDQAEQDGLITTFMKNTIAEMSNKVVDALAEKFDGIRKGVKSAMGGKVIDYEAKRIHDEGIVLGQEQGEMNKAQKTAINLKKMGMAAPNIAAALEVTEELVNKWTINIQPA